MKILLDFLYALPELIKLIQTIQKRIDEEEADRKVKDDVKEIHEAFQSKDADRLNKLFNSK